MIDMVRGYSPPPNEGGVAYSGFSQFGYTHITQEGVGHSEPHEEAFTPIEHWNGYGEDSSGMRPALVPHPNVHWRAQTGFDTPGPLGGCCGGSGGPRMSMNRFGETSTGTKLGVAAVLAFLFFSGSKKPRGYGRAPSRKRSRR